MTASDGSRAQVHEPSRDEVQEAVNALLDTLSQALDAYLSMVDDGREVDCREWTERLAERWRVPMERYRLEQLGDDFLSDEGVQLYAALETSFILSRSRDPERQALRLDARELVGRYLGAGEGIWHEHWKDLHETILTEIDRRAGGPVDVPYITVKRPPRLSRFQRRRNREVASLIELTGETWTDAGIFYRDLAPDGRELSEEERAGAYAQLEATAEVDRRVDLAREVFSQSDWRQMQLMLAEMRSLRRGLALALSSDPARRVLALTVDEGGIRAFIMNERILGATHEQAIERLKARMEAEA